MQGELEALPPKHGDAYDCKGRPITQHELTA